MKKFRKTNNDLFICEECNKTFTSIRKLSRHITVFHENTKSYHEKWLKEEFDDKCKICKNSTDFINLSYGYKKCCSKICSNIYSHNKSIEGNVKKYGVENSF